MDHVLQYRAGSCGLSHLGVPDNNAPHWYCTCGQWRLNRNPRTGAPHKETATKHHKKHTKEFRMVDELQEYPCPECEFDGPHNPIDDSAIECGRCYTSIDITGGEQE
jgi:hypothetical protein